MHLIRREPERDPRFEYIFAMYLMYATRPSNPAPDAAGMFDIGEVGDAPEERPFDRWCPYSVAQKRK